MKSRRGLVIPGLCFLAALIPIQGIAAPKVTALAVSKDNEILLLGDQTGTISAWSIADGSRLWSVKGAGLPIRDLGYSDNQHVVAVYGGRSMCVVPIGGAKCEKVELDYQYLDADGRGADTVASAILPGNKLLLGSSGFARAYLVSSAEIEAKSRVVPIIALESFMTEELGIADYTFSQPTGPPDTSVLARIDYGSNPGGDEWTDFSGCPKAPTAVGTTKEGYLLAWNLNAIAGLRKDAYLPTLKPEYQRRIGKVSGSPQALRGVACSASNFVATIGDGSSHYGELQIWSLSGELKSDPISDNERSLHAGGGRRVAWDPSGRYLVTAAASEYVVWTWNGRTLHAAAKLALSDQLPLVNGRPVVSVGDGRFILTSGSGAFLYDAGSRTFGLAFGASPSRILAQPPRSSVRQPNPVETYSAFFEHALIAVVDPTQVKTLHHPLFKVFGSQEIDLDNRKMNSLATFSCDFGSSFTDLIDERKECFQNLQKKWAGFLEKKGLRLEVTHNYSLPGWIRVLMTARSRNTTQFQYLFESETNPAGTSGYAQVTILRNPTNQ